MTDKTIYDLELHEVFMIEPGRWVIRVPGGWTYNTTYEIFNNGIWLMPTTKN